MFLFIGWSFSATITSVTQLKEDIACLMLLVFWMLAGKLSFVNHKFNKIIIIRYFGVERWIKCILCKYGELTKEFYVDKTPWTERTPEYEEIDCIWGNWFSQTNSSYYDDVPTPAPLTCLLQVKIWFRISLWTINHNSQRCGTSKTIIFT